MSPIRTLVAPSGAATNRSTYTDFGSAPNSVFGSWSLGQVTVSPKVNFALPSSVTTNSTPSTKVLNWLIRFAATGVASGSVGSTSSLLGVDPPLLPPLEEPPLFVFVGDGVATATVVGAEVRSGPICTFTLLAAITLTGLNSNLTPLIFTSATSTLPLPKTSITASVTNEVIVAPSFTSKTAPVDALSIVTFAIVPPDTSTLTFAFISILSIIPANTFISASFASSLACNFAMLPFVTSIFDSDNISTLLKSPSNCTIASDFSFFTSTSSNPTPLKSFSSSLPPERICILPTFVLPLASNLTFPSFF